MMDIKQYQNVNESFQRRLIYHVGNNCGFFVELNYMLNAMLYCLEHGLRFQIYFDALSSAGHPPRGLSTSQFSVLSLSHRAHKHPPRGLPGEGWTEFFLPFCTEVHEPFHRRYNFHRPPSWRRIFRNTLRERSFRFVVWKLKTMLLTVIGHVKAYRVYGERVLLGQDVAPEPATYYHIPALGIQGDYYQAYGELARMVWRLRPEILAREAEVVQALRLPPHYAGIQIRGGDKSSEAQLIDGRPMVAALAPADGDCVFVLTDDVRLLNDVRAAFPRVRFFSMCSPTDKGYDHQAFSKASPQVRKDAIVRLLISVDLLLAARQFVGSITTGPSVFIMKVRSDDTAVRAVDCPSHQLKSVLTLTIDRRAAISALHSPSSV